MTQLKNVEDVYPLSPMQALMLTHALAARARGNQRDASFSQIVYDIHGALNVEAFAEAWRAQLRRHTALRTAVLHEGLKQPVQVVRREAALEFIVDDWRGHTDAPARLDAWLAADRARGFDLTAAPLMRFALFQCADQAYRFVWSSHHIVVDRWCIGLLLGEARALYAGAQRPPARPFRDYIGWLQKRNPAVDEAFWRNRLNGAPDLALATPGDGRASGYASLRRTLDVETTAALRAWIEPARLTLNTVCAAAFILARAGGADDVTIGMTLSGRPAELPGVEGIAGCFINNVPFRARPGAWADRLIGDWLRDIQSQLLDVQEHGHVSPLKLEEWRGEGARGPLYEALYVYQAEVRTRADADGLDLRPVSGELNAALPIVLAAGQEADTLVLTLSHDRARLGDAGAAALIDLVVHALQLLAVWPRQTLGALRAQLPVNAPAAPAAARPDGLLDHVEAGFHPANPIEAQLLHIWRRTLGQPELGVEESAFHAGATSLQSMRIMAQVESRFGKSLPVTALYQAPSPREFARLLADGSSTPEWRRLVPIQPAGTRTPIFMVHHGAGSTYGFNGIARHLHAERPLYGLQESGWQDDEPFPHSLEQMAGDYVAEVRTVQPHGPYVLGGFCFGGLVAYEMAQQLRAAGEPVALLVLMDAYAPVPLPAPKSASERARSHAQRLAGMRPTQRAAYLLQRAGRRVYWAGANARMRARNLAWSAINETFPRMGLTVDSRVRGHAFLKWNALLQDKYSPRSYDGRALLIRSARIDLPDDYGWNGFVTRGVEVHQMRTDDHLEMLTKEHAVEVARVIEAAVNDAR